MADPLTTYFRVWGELNTALGEGPIDPRLADRAYTAFKGLPKRHQRRYASDLYAKFLNFSEDEDILSYIRARMDTDEIERVETHVAKDYATIGAVAIRRRQPGMAELALRRAVDLMPEDVRYRRLLGRAIFRTGYHEGALGEMKKALAISKKNARTYKELGRMYLSIDEPEKAAECFARAALGGYNADEMKEMTIDVCEDRGLTDLDSYYSRVFLGLEEMGGISDDEMEGMKMLNAEWEIYSDYFEVPDDEPKEPE